MRQIKIGFTDYFPTFDDFIMDTLSKRYNVIRNDDTPDYLFFCDETFGTQNQLPKYSKIPKRIFFTGENRRPWNYNCHHAISFEHLEGRQFYRLPLYVVEEWVMVNKLGMPSLNERITTPGLPQKSGFCSFIVSNGGCKERNDMFFALSKYRQVDSGGPLYNNIGGALPRGSTAQIDKIKFMESRKFSLCYENSSYPGYVTEKIFHAFYARAIPIYWGSPCVEMDFNPHAFISRHDFKSDEEMIEHIMMIDKNDSLYYHMLHQNPLNSRNTRFDLGNLLDWFEQTVEVRWEG